METDGCLRRKESNDCRHGESKTRFIWALGTEIIPSMNIADTEIRIDFVNLIVSPDNDAPAITMASDISSSAKVVHQIRSTYIDISGLHEFLKTECITPRAVCFVYAIGGSELSPSIRGVGHKHYISVLFQHVQLLDDAFDSATISGSGTAAADNNEGCSQPQKVLQRNVSSETLVAAAYLHAGKASIASDIPLSEAPSLDDSEV